jgi:Putative Ig domain/Lactonase, 7-bladed beta-propeller
VQPVVLAVSPDGKSAYVTNQNENTVSQYTIEPSGALSPKTPATVATGASPQGVAVSPDGASAYVTNRSDNTVSQYAIDPLSGALSPQTPASVAAPNSPVGVTVGPLPCGAMQVKTRTLPAATRGMTYKAELTACGGIPPYKWKKVGALPKGLKLSKTGVISGTPSAKKVAPGSHPLGVKVTDSKKHSATATLTLNVN